MTFLSHGKPENFKISAKNCFLNCGNWKAVLKSFGKPEKNSKDNEKWQKPGKQENKLRKAGKKHEIFHGNPENGPCITPLI